MSKNSASIGTEYSFFKVTWFRAWFPALPFLAYWLLTFLLYEYGPLINPSLSLTTYFYLFVCMLLFLFGYMRGLKFRKTILIEPHPENVILVNNYVRKLMRFLLPLSFLGTLGFVIDRIISGAGSFAKTIYETQYVRTDELSTTFLTTISVLPYSFSLIAITLYFYCYAMHWRISRISSICFWGIIVALCLNAFLSANRGNIFWILIYILFWFYFVQGESSSRLLRDRAYRYLRIVLLFFLVLFVSYSFFISRNRNTELFLNYEAQRYSMIDRYGLFATNIDPLNLAAGLQLATYGTHQYEFIDVFVMNSEPFAFHPSMLAGGRILDQIKRFDSEYVPEASEVAKEWISLAGLPPFAWPSIFGWLLVLFGYIGAPTFMLILGLVYSSFVGHFLRHFDAASLILIFCMFAALNMSFNWIGGDFTNNMGYLVGSFLLIKTRKKLKAYGFI